MFPMYLFEGAIFYLYRPVITLLPQLPNRLKESYVIIYSSFLVIRVEVTTKNSDILVEIFKTISLIHEDVKIMMCLTLTYFCTY